MTSYLSRQSLGGSHVVETFFAGTTTVLAEELRRCRFGAFKDILTDNPRRTTANTRPRLLQRINFLVCVGQKERKKVWKREEDTSPVRSP